MDTRMRNAVIGDRRGSWPELRAGSCEKPTVALPRHQLAPIRRAPPETRVLTKTATIGVAGQLDHWFVHPDTELAFDPATTDAEPPPAPPRWPTARHWCVAAFLLATA